VNINATTGEIMDWHYNEGEKIAFEQPAEEAKSTARIVHLQAPISEEDVRDLHVGDVVKISGRMYTGRDAIHKHLMDNDAPVDLNGQVIYHCGPVVLKNDEGKYEIKA